MTNLTEEFGYIYGINGLDEENDTIVARRVSNGIEVFLQSFDGFCSYTLAVNSIEDTEPENRGALSEIISSVGDYYEFATFVETVDGKVIPIVIVSSDEVVTTNGKRVDELLVASEEFEVDDCVDEYAEAFDMIGCVM